MAKKEIIKTENAPAPIGPYNQAVKVGDIVYVSGQIALDAKTGELNMENLNMETHQVMKNILALLDAGEMGIENLVKCSIFLDDIDNFSIVDSIYSSYFKSEFPARETVEVSKLPKGVRVEISGVAVN